MEQDTGQGMEQDQNEEAGIQQDAGFGAALSNLIETEGEFAASAAALTSFEEGESLEHLSKQQAVTSGWLAVYAVADAYCARYHAQQVEQEKQLKRAGRLINGEATE